MQKAIEIHLPHYEISHLSPHYSSFFSVRPQKLETNWGSNNFTEVCIICRQFSKGQVFEPLPFLTNTITGQCWLLTTVICNEIQSHLCINPRRKQNKNKDVTFTNMMTVVEFHGVTVEIQYF